MEGWGNECGQVHDVTFPKNQKKYYAEKKCFLQLESSVISLLIR